MKPTKEDCGKFWWIQYHGSDPDIVRIEWHDCRKCLVAWWTGWDIPEEVDKMKNVEWLGEVEPFKKIIENSWF